MPLLLNLFNEETYSPFSTLLKLRENCHSPIAMSLPPALPGNTEATEFDVQTSFCCGKGVACNFFCLGMECHLVFSLGLIAAAMSLKKC